MEIFSSHSIPVLRIINLATLLDVTTVSGHGSGQPILTAFRYEYGTGTEKGIGISTSI